MLLRTDRGEAVLAETGNADWLAPDLINVEVLSTLRRLQREGTIGIERASQAVTDLRNAPVERMPTVPLILAMWARRNNLSAYDACYVALAESIPSRLITADVRLSRAPGLAISVISV